MRLKFKFLIALLAVFALVVSACGNDDDDGDGAAPAPAPTEAATEAPAPAPTEAPTEAPAPEPDPEPMADSIDIDGILAADLNNCAAPPTGDPIRVGMAMDFSDVVGFVDIPGSKLVPFIAEKVNCTGGINGSPVEVRVAEVGDDAVLATQELLDWGAHFLIGPPFADFALPILQTTEGQVPLFVAASTEPTLADASINSFLVTFDDYGMSGAAAQWSYDQGITRAIVFTEGEGIPYTGVNPDAFIAKFEELGGEVVSVQTYVWAADTDFSAQVNEIAGISQNNEVVFSAALGFQVTALRGQLEGQGLDGLDLHRHRRLGRHRHPVRGQQRGHRPHPTHQHRSGRPHRHHAGRLRGCQGRGARKPGLHGAVRGLDVPGHSGHLGLWLRQPGRHRRRGGPDRGLPKA